MKTLLSVAIRSYGYLLRLYPRRFREEFGDEMLSDFSDMANDAGRNGLFSLILFCLREFIDFPINLLRVHFEEGLIFRILRSQPMNIGLRSALGFGMAFALTLPISILASETVFYPIDSIVTRLSIYYYDRFRVEPGFELMYWIPSAISSLFTGLILGSAIAFLFAERSKYKQYIFAGLLGWFLQDTVGDIFIMFFQTWIFLDGNQFEYFQYTVSAFSGAVFGLIFVVAKSEHPDAENLLTKALFAYPLFAYLWVELLSNLFVFNTPWRFVGLMLLMTILIASVFVLGLKIDGSRKLLWVVIAGTIGRPVLSYLTYFIAQIISPPIPSSGILTDGHPFFWLELILSNGVYGILIGLLLGLVLGLQNRNSPPEIVV